MITWQDIYDDFRERNPQFAGAVEDWRPIAPYTIQLWVPSNIGNGNAVHLHYNYLTKNLESGEDKYLK